MVPELHVLGGERCLKGKVSRVSGVHPVGHPTCVTRHLLLIKFTLNSIFGVRRQHTRGFHAGILWLLGLQVVSSSSLIKLLGHSSFSAIRQAAQGVSAMPEEPHLQFTW